MPAKEDPATPPLADVATLALEQARRQGATQCEADVSVSQGLSVSVRLGEVDTVEYQRDRGLGVTVYFGQRKGSASTADLTPAAVRETVAKACAIARYTAEVPTPAWSSPRRWRARSPTWTSTTPGSSLPKRPSSSRAAARRRVWRSIRASATQKAPG